MKKIISLFAAVLISLTLGLVSAEEDTRMPWQQQEATPLLKSKNKVKGTGKTSGTRKKTGGKNKKQAQKRPAYQTKPVSDSKRVTETKSGGKKSPGIWESFKNMFSSGSSK